MDNRMYKTSHFSHRHYEFFADVLAEMYNDPKTYDEHTVGLLESLLSERFSRDNWGFDPARFSNKIGKNLHNLQDKT